MNKQTTVEGNEAADVGNPQVLGRRQALQIFGGSIGAITVLATGAGCSKADGKKSMAATPPGVRQVLSDADFLLVGRLSEVIIPKTDTAGAIETQVPEFIDAALAASASDPYVASGSADDFVRWDNLRLLFADGLRWIDEQAKNAHGAGFVSLSGEQQLALLEPMYAQIDAGAAIGRGAQFLRALKDLTVEGYYSSRPGLFDELGYKGHGGAHAQPPAGCKS
jgi:gluconate 2-dehydrogenase gamma chain